MLRTRIATALATGAVLLNLAAPAYADTNITISGNGRNSNNDAVVNLSSNQTVNQTNVANVSNNVDVNANTGGNKANDNLGGGNVNVTSGDARVATKVTNNLNSNQAQIDCGCLNTGDTKAAIVGNGRNSNNTLNLDMSHNTTVDQTNVANVNNDVDVNASTGNNKANDNLGGGNVKVKSGDAFVTTNVSTSANANSARIGGGNGNGGSLTAVIADNGRKSDNDLILNVTDSASVDQTNVANIDNNVDVNAKTGGNKANDNLGGGNVRVESGDAGVGTSINNRANFNAADVDCGCLLGSGDVKVNVSGNGRNSDNDLNAFLDSFQTFDQTNVGNLDNYTNIDATTGYNKANDNGGANNADPSVKSGDSISNTTVNNSANLNSVGSVPSMDLPNMNFSFDWQGFFAWWTAHQSA